MNLAFDASVIIKWFVAEPLHERALLLLDTVELAAAPDFVIVELANIVWKKGLRSEITLLQARSIIADARTCIPVLMDSALLADRALEIAQMLSHPVYDCLYIACAEAGDTLLVTADRRLCEATTDSPFAGTVRYLADIDPLALPA